MQLKHIFVFLLVFLVSFADATVYSQKKSSEFHQSSKVVQNRNFNGKKTKYFTFKKSLSKDCFLTYFFSKAILELDFIKQTVLILKLQKHLYQKITLANIQHTFLTIKITSSNTISTLYIA